MECSRRNKKRPRTDDQDDDEERFICAIQLNVHRFQFLADANNANKEYHCVSIFDFDDNDRGGIELQQVDDCIVRTLHLINPEDAFGDRETVTLLRQGFTTSVQHRGPFSVTFSFPNPTTIALKLHRNRLADTDPDLFDMRTRRAQLKVVSSLFARRGRYPRREALGRSYHKASTENGSERHARAASSLSLMGFQGDLLQHQRRDLRRIFEVSDMPIVVCAQQMILTRGGEAIDPRTGDISDIPPEQRNQSFVRCSGGAYMGPPSSGKTLVILTFIASLKIGQEAFGRVNKHTAGVVVSNKTIAKKWSSEIKQHAPNFTCIALTNMRDTKKLPWTPVDGREADIVLMTVDFLLALQKAMSKSYDYDLSHHRAHLRCKHLQTQLATDPT